MPYNTPTVTTNRLSFGPGIVRLGATGATPSTDVGVILADDGITIEVVQEVKAIEVGNPKLDVLKFAQKQGMKVSFNGLDWDLDNFAFALGAGTTASASGVDSLAWGGDASLTAYAMQVEHQMAQSGQTIFIEVWQAVSDGGFTIPLNQDEHRFDYKFSALRTTSNWAGTALGSTAELFRIRHQTT